MFSPIRKPALRTGSHLALAIALVTGASIGMPGMESPAVAKERKKDEGPKTNYSKGFVAAYKPVDALSKAGDNAGAEAQLDTVIAAVETDDDRNAAGGLVYNVGTSLNDSSLQRRGIAMMLESGRLDQAKTGQFNYTAYQLAAQDGEFDTARAYLEAAIDADYSFTGKLTDGTTKTFGADDIRMILAETYFEEENYDGGLAYIRKLVEDRVAAGQVPPRDWLIRARSKAYNNDLALPAIEFANQLVSYYPDTESWRDAVNIQRNVVLMEGPELLDLMRLAYRLGTLQSSRDYLDYADAADFIRAPAEVKRLLERGRAAGAFSANDPTSSEALKMASDRIEDDKRDLPGLERDAMAASAAASLVTSAADAYMSYENYAKAEALYKVALGRPGVNEPLANMRLGIAQLGLGKFDEAKASFAKVTGQRRPIASLWTIYTDQLAKEAGAGAAVDAAAEATAEM